VKHISEVLKEMGWPETLRSIAARVRSNLPRHRHPEKFHDEIDQIASDLETLAKERSLR
jgi:hypothetical protein